MKTVKAKSSKYINDHSLTKDRFEWQEGYGVFSYHRSMVDKVFHYIRNQVSITTNRSLKKNMLHYWKSIKSSMTSSTFFKT